MSVVLLELSWFVLRDIGVCESVLLNKCHVVHGYFGVSITIVQYLWI